MRRGIRVESQLSPPCSPLRFCARPRLKRSDESSQDRRDMHATVKPWFPVGSAGSVRARRQEEECRDVDVGSDRLIIYYGVAGIRGSGESTGALNPRRAPIECPGLAGTARRLLNATAARPAVQTGDIAEEDR